MRIRCNGTGKAADCGMVFGSWTYNGDQIDLQNGEGDELGMEKDYGLGYSRFEVGDATSMERNVKMYACCPEPYPDIVIKFRVARKMPPRSSWSLFSH